MANELKMSVVNALLLLAERGWSHRRIARELGIHRETVSRYIRLASKPAISTAGSRPDLQRKPAISTAGVAGRRSLCDAYRHAILEKLDEGLSAIRIHQDLITDHGFEGSYESVKRYVRRMQATTPAPFRRMESAPGEEAQADFGKGAWVITADGRRRRPHLFRIVLSHSRKGYSEVVWRQRTEDLIRCLENAFWSFGGVPKTLVVDNTKAAVMEADWYDPQLTPKFEEFARHYGIAVLPTRPYTPRHKGKIEGGIKYAQDNGLKGKTFASLEEQNHHLKQWESQVADHRIHGTTRKQVLQLFEESERPALSDLPPHRFPFFQEGKRKVHRDGHIAVDNAYYSVPPEYFGREVWVRWDARLVRVLNHERVQIAVHARAEPGRFSTRGEHIISKKISDVERGAVYLLSRASRIGPESARWAQAVMRTRGIEGIRPLRGFLSLAAKHSALEIEQACRVAISHGSFRLKTLRHLIRHPKEEKQVQFLETHPLIRNLAEYDDLVSVSIQRHQLQEGDSMYD